MTATSKRNPSGYRKTGRQVHLAEERRIKAEKWDALVTLVNNSRKYRYGEARQLEAQMQRAILQTYEPVVMLIDEEVHPDTNTAKTWAFGFWRRCRQMALALRTLQDVFGEVR